MAALFQYNFIIFNKTSGVIFVHSRVTPVPLQRQLLPPVTFDLPASSQPSSRLAVKCHLPQKKIKN